MPISLPVIPESAFEEMPNYYTIPLDDLSEHEADPKESRTGTVTHVEQLIGRCRIGVIRQSSIETLNRCPREFMFRYRFGLVTKGADRPGATTIGTFFHKLMEFYYQDLPEQLAVDWCGDSIEKSVDAILSDEDTLGFAKGEAQLRADFEKNLAMARVMASIFIQKFPKQPGWVVASTEQEIAVTHEALRNVPIGGRIDLILHDTNKDEYWVVDHKTTSLDPTTYAMALPFALQARLYRLLVQSANPTWKVTGVIHNVVAKPSIHLGQEDRPKEPHTLKSGKNKGQVVMRPVEGSLPDFTNYLERCVDWYQGTGQYDDQKYERATKPMMLQSVVEFPKTMRLIDKELLGVLVRAARASRAVTNLDRFPRYSSACIRYNRMCSYMPLCRDHASQWGLEIAKRYTRTTEVTDEQPE